MWEFSQPRNTVQSYKSISVRKAVGSKGKRLNNFPYLDPVIKEVIYLYQPIPMSFLQYVPGQGRGVD